MAVKKVSFGIAFKQNRNQTSQAYGKYYPEAWTPETLNLRGLVERVAMDQSVYSRDICEGVIQRLTKVMVELLQSGQPVKWDGLGTFTPKVESARGGLTEAKLADGDFNVADVVEGIHVRFIPENSKGEELTSSKFKDSCVLETLGVIELTQTNPGCAQGKEKYARSLVSLEAWRIKNGTSPSPSGGSTSPNPSEGGESDNTGGSQSGNSGEQNQPTGYALTISKMGSGSASVTKDGNAVTSGASLNEDDEVEISITPAEGTVPSATLNGSSIELTENDGVYTGNFAMPGQAASLVINTGSASGDSSI